MSEYLIKALMKLFAIIAKEDGITQTERNVVENFLKQQLNQEGANEYMEWFNKYVEEESLANFNAICIQANLELTQKQKIIVILRLFELVIADSVITRQEEEFISTVKAAFNINHEEFQIIKNFVTTADIVQVSVSDLVLLISENPLHKEKTKQFIAVDNLNGYMAVLRIPSVELYILRYISYKGINPIDPLHISDIYLNGVNIIPNHNYLFTPGSAIRLAKINPIYYSDVVSQFLKVDDYSKIFFNVDSVEYKFPKGNIGLRDVSIYENSGKLIGFMGASGAGKSTLLNVLNGNDRPNKGSVTINGADIHKDKQAVMGVVGFVSQDDLLMEDLTVYQNLFYNAKLCFKNHTEKQIDQLVMKVLSNLGLAETKGLKVGTPLHKTISGGQRKRLNIGLELLREPAVLFLDEPTSGLSSRDSENIMDLLKELSLRGKLVFVVIHQPSSDIFKMFDKLLILDVGGYPIYYGNPIEAVAYFKRIANYVNSETVECLECGSVNPELIFNIIESKILDEYGNFTKKRKITPEKWNEYYLQNVKIEKSKETAPIPEGMLQIPSKIKQMGVFITRDILSKISNVQYMFINLLEAPLLAFVLAYVVRYFNIEKSESQTYVFGLNENITAYMFMSIVVALFMGLTVSAEEIIRDRKILKREQFLNLSRVSYLFSKVIILFAISAIQTYTYVILGNSMLGIKGMTIDYWLVLFSVSCFANMLGLNVSASFNSAVTIYILIPILLIPQLILSGVIVKFDKLNPTLTSDRRVPLIGDLMTSRWAFEALAVNQFVSNEFEKDFYSYDKQLKNAYFKKQFLVPELIKKNEWCTANLNSEQDSIKELLKLAVELLNREVGILQNNTSDNKFSNYTKLNVTDYNTEVGASLSGWLSELKTYYNKTYNKVYDEKDKLINSMQDTKEKKDEFVRRKETYHNQNIEELVSNHLEINIIVERENQLIQKVDQVFLDPVDPRNILDYRTHFYAPKKHFFNRYYSTFGFNIMMIWVMSFILYFTLYYESIKKFLDMMESFFQYFTVKRKG